MPRGLVATCRRVIKLVRLGFYVLLAGGVAGSLAIRCLITGDLPHARPLAAWYKARLCRMLGLVIHTRGEAVQRPVFLVANHVSWLDIVVIGGLLPVNFVSKAEVAGWPLIGWLVKHGGTLFIPRGAHQAGEIGRQIGERLGRGAAVLVFPEGTTSDGAKVRPFFPRLFAPAVESGWPVQPIALSYRHPSGVHPTAPFVDDDPLPAHLWRVLGEKRIEVEVTFLPVLDARGTDRRTLATRSRREICVALGLPEGKPDAMLKEG